MMNTRQINSYPDDIAAGKIERKQFYWKFGSGEVGASDLTTIWSGGSADELYEYPTEAINLYLVSSSAEDVMTTGTGAWTVKVTGLDKHYKKQEEIVELDGTTPVATTYKYLRVFRMEVASASTAEGQAGTISAKNQAADKTYAVISNGTLKTNQTQMGLFTVPAGHSISAHVTQISSGGGKETNIYLYSRRIADNAVFALKQNWKVKDQTFSATTPIPFYLPELVDVEFRGLTETSAEEVAIALIGHEEQLNSVPVDLSNFSITAGENTIEVDWDEQTPAETQDLKGFEVVVTPGLDGHSLSSFLISDKDATGVTIEGLDPNTEYTVTAAWVGYDDLKSTVEEEVASTELLAPSGLTASRFKNSDSVTLNWTDNTLVSDTIEVWRSLTTTTGFVKFADVDLEEETLEDSSAREDDTYYYKARSKYNTAYSDYSSEASTDVTQILAVLEDVSVAYSDDQGATWSVDAAPLGVQTVIPQSIEIYRGNLAATGAADTTSTPTVTNWLWDGTDWTSTIETSFWQFRQYYGGPYFWRVEVNLSSETVGVDYSTDGVNWTSSSDISTFDPTQSPAFAWDGTNYYMEDGATVYFTTDGDVWAPLAVQPPASPIALMGREGLLIVASEADTTMDYYYSTDAGATWSTAVTSSITGTQPIPQKYAGTEYGDHIYVLIADSQSEDYGFALERTEDGSSFTEVTLPTVAGVINHGYLDIHTDGELLYVAIVDTDTSNSYMSSYDGTSWSTPVAVSTGAAITGFATYKSI